jgi:hypothetical protein
MEPNESIQNQFDQAFQHNYNVLKAAFLQEVGKASDREYAIQHYRNILFEQNDLIPYRTVFFQELITTFQHLNRLDETTALQRTLEYLPQICNSSEQAFEQVMLALSSSLVLRFSQLPDLYKDFLSDESNNLSLEQLAYQEQLAMKSDEEDTIELLALYLASQQLLVETEPDTEAQIPETKLEHSHQFTRSQQVLFAHYIFKMAGIEPRINADISACAEIVHGLTGMPYTTIKNSELYKKFRDPIGNSSPTKVKKDLELVRSYFAKLDHPKLLDLIDKDIRGLSEIE